jgi:hypothetical protein
LPHPHARIRDVDTARDMSGALKVFTDADCLAVGLKPCMRPALFEDFHPAIDAQHLGHRWRRLDGHNQLPKLILLVKLTDGLEVAVKSRSAVSPQPPPTDQSGRQSAIASALGLACEPEVFNMTGRLMVASAA